MKLLASTIVFALCLSVSYSLASANKNNYNDNVIEYNTSPKLRFDRQGDMSNIIGVVKSVIKLIFGKPDEINQSSRQLLSFVTKGLEHIKTFIASNKARHELRFNEQQRSAERSINGSNGDKLSEQSKPKSEPMSEIALAGVSMLQGYVKAVLANDSACVKRALCEASHEAVTKSNREFGYVVSLVGGYASSYFLDSFRTSEWKNLYEASRIGRAADTNCKALYKDCSDSQLNSL